MNKIGFTGDIALSGIINEFTDEQIRANMDLGKITGYAGLIINLEATVVTSESVSLKTKGVKLRSSHDALSSFIGTNNIIAVSLANNHSLDYGSEGINNVIQILDLNNIPHTGAGLRPKHLEPAIFEHAGSRHALLGYVHSETNPFIPEELYLNIYDRNEIISAIKRAKTLADKVILSLHWGKDYSAYPLDWQINDAHEFINSGADIIIGHHTHVAQPFEVFSGRYIFYGLGSTLFGDFYLYDRLRALPVKTKRSFIPCFTELTDKPQIVATRELIGNKVIAEKKAIVKWSSRMMRRTLLKNRIKLYSSILSLKEGLADRIFDVFFGYYRKPLRDLCRSKTWHMGFNFIRNKS
jgi:hypothetical protein